jgi:hypothetical protein
MRYLTSAAVAREGIEARQRQPEDKDAQKRLSRYPGHVLKNAGITLRLRRVGRRWTQTVKTKAKLRGGLSQVDELENPAPGGRLCLEAIPDASVRDEIIRRVNGSPLQPVCETVMKRTASELSLGEAPVRSWRLTLARSAPMGARPSCGKRKLSSSKAGLPTCSTLRMRCFPDGGLRFSRVSNAARGYLLAGELSAE